MSNFSQYQISYFKSQLNVLKEFSKYLLTFLMILNVNFINEKYLFNKHHLKFIVIPFFIFDIMQFKFHTINLIFLFNFMFIPINHFFINEQTPILLKNC